MAPGKGSGEMGPVPATEAGLPGRHPHAARSAREGSVPGPGPREEISCGRNWPRGAGAQPAKHPQRTEAELLPAFGRHWLPAALGSQEYVAYARCRDGRAGDGSAVPDG